MSFKAKTPRDHFRKVQNGLMLGLLCAASLIAIFPLLSVFLYVLQRGLIGVNLEFFTALPAAVGELGGGMGNAVLGSLMIVGLAACGGVPIGIAIGIYLSEYGHGRFLPRIIRFATDLMTSIPSIVTGIFVYTLIVVPMKGFSTFAGAVALALIMIPAIARTTEEILKLVPSHIKEAGLALGLPRYKVILNIIVKGTMGGIITGVMLAIARASGETAPLLFTAFNNRFWPSRFSEPTASLPVQIYTYAISPYEEWHRQAWAGALVLVLLVFVFNLMVRTYFAFKGRS